jgi:hypothetical protein
MFGVRICDDVLPFRRRPANKKIKKVKKIAAQSSRCYPRSWSCRPTVGFGWGVDAIPAV